MTRENPADRARRYEGASVLHAPDAGGAWRYQPRRKPRSGRIRAGLLILAAIVAAFWVLV